MILTVGICGTNIVDGTVVSSKLNLIDLAGSERLSKTEATGDRLTEAKNINKSLSALGDVIQSLSTRKKRGSQHVPFRNSKLTHLLKDSLSGQSKVLMFLNASPASSNENESICSLNFASRCRDTELGQVQRNISSSRK